MDSPTWGDVIQATSSVLVAIVFGWWIHHRYAHRLSIKEVFCRELDAILSDVRVYERRVREVYQYRGSDYSTVIGSVIADSDLTRRRAEVVREVLSRKLNDAQLPSYTEFHEAYLRFEFVLRSLEHYFSVAGPVADHDARLDMSGPVHLMSSSLMRIEIQAG